MSHKVEFYQLPKSKRWRWKILYGKKVLARSEGNYASKSDAKTSLVGVMNGMAKLRDEFLGTCY